MTAMYGLCAESAETLDDLDEQLNPLPVDDAAVQEIRRAAILRLGGEIA